MRHDLLAAVHYKVPARPPQLPALPEPHAAGCLSILLTNQGPDRVRPCCSTDTGCAVRVTYLSDHPLRSEAGERPAEGATGGDKSHRLWVSLL